MGASLLIACSQKVGAPPTGASPVETARGWLAGGPFPARPTAIAGAQAVALEAQKDQASARGVELHTLAARVMERVYRDGGRSQDGKEAIDLYRAAAVRLEEPASCDAAIVGARLTGEVAGDPEQAYAELYRVDRRLEGKPAPACRDRVQGELLHLALFRPAPAVLDAIDQALAAAGVAPLGDAGAAKVALPTEDNRLERIEKWVGPEGARVVLFLRRPAPFRVGDDVAASGKPRTYVDVEGLAGDAKAELATVGIVTRIRAEPQARGTRVSLELDGKAYRKVFHLVEPYRIVVDVARKPPATGRSVSRIVLDPGHGGNDPGATSPAGVYEKDVTLSIAHKVAPVLSKEGISVVLTRDDDRYVTLEERTARANAASADLFVSIHCNAAEGHARHGIETYVLDTSTGDMEQRLAARENATSAAATAELSSILASMRIADQSQRSRHFADLLQRAAVAAVRPAHPGVVDGGVKNAGFYVLVGARMPGVLFEASYISNTDEGALLATDDYRGRLADGIVNAIRAYKEGR